MCNKNYWNHLFCNILTWHPVVLQMSPCNSQETHWSHVYSCRLWWPCSPQTSVTMLAPVGPFIARSRGAFIFDVWCRTTRTYTLALAGHTKWDGLSALTCVWPRPPLASMYWGIVLSVGSPELTQARNRMCSPISESLGSTQILHRRIASLYWKKVAPTLKAALVNLTKLKSKPQKDQTVSK